MSRRKRLLAGMALGTAIAGGTLALCATAASADDSNKVEQLIKDLTVTQLDNINSVIIENIREETEEND
ncbi:hypothetical protein [Nonomuraea turcica]|uniref:hypothetical protein n=1 Tax=Nonomuraea sp. G32 TaxID=3067274 RepID=UPI00273B8B2A|nr:hypothetical protein [Nonomuraea sp. G32]MDP4510631.1 hypothetical protein [Nonomuraea sp. G32]